MSNGATKAMWLYMLRARRPVKASELAKQTCIDDSSARAMLKSMVEACSVIRHEPTETTGVLYEVTVNCLVPRFVSVKEVRDAA